MDLQEVLKLLDLMESHGLDEIEVEQGGVRIRLKKAGHASVVAPVIAAPLPPAHSGGNPTAAPAAEKLAAKEEELAQVTSPMVGTFYRAASPDADPFVSEGDRVTPEQVICIIEAMKVINEIKAEVEGEVVSILVENGESVEYGQAMMTIRRAGPSAK